MSSSRNTDPSCHLWVWLFHDNAPAHKSLVAQQAVCNCEFVQLNHPAYSTDLAPSDYFLIRSPKYHRGTWFIDDNWWITEGRCRGMVWGSKQKILFSGHKQLRRKLEKMHWCCRKICWKSDNIRGIICSFLYPIANFLIVPCIIVR